MKFFKKTFWYGQNFSELDINGIIVDKWRGERHSYVAVEPGRLAKYNTEDSLYSLEKKMIIDLGV